LEGTRSAPRLISQKNNNNNLFEGTLRNGVIWLARIIFEHRGDISEEIPSELIAEGKEKYLNAAGMMNNLKYIDRFIEKTEKIYSGKDYDGRVEDVKDLRWFKELCECENGHYY